MCALVKVGTRMAWENFPCHQEPKIQPLLCRYLGRHLVLGYRWYRKGTLMDGMDRLVDLRGYRPRFRDLETVEETKLLKGSMRGMLLIYHG